MIEQVSPKYIVTIREPESASALKRMAGPGAGHIEREMVKAHLRKRAAGEDIARWGGYTDDAVAALEDRMMDSLAETAGRAKGINATFADGDDAIDRAVRNFTTQVVVDGAVNRGKSLQAIRQVLLDIGSTDIRDNLPPEPESEAERRPMVVQPPGPRLRRAGLFEGGKTKYVIDD